ncbi:MAG: hypothetical protein HQ539_03400 [Parcubacteria group bacterium]|nr:hypothetical protein [Parcubacteria group bacterium]
MSKKEPTKEKILASVEKRKKSEQWYYNDYWREKGTPVEQLRVEHGANTIDIYNFSSDVELNKEYQKQIEIVMQFFAEHFPQALEGCKTILINDKQSPSAYGDEDKFPFNGEVKRDWNTLILYPNAIKSTPHRTGAVDHFSGTLTHELTHFFARELLEEWQKHYQWEEVDENDPEWISMPNASSMIAKSMYHKEKGYLAFEDKFPAQPPEDFVSEYAMLSAEEDICDSNVVFAFDADKLKEVSSIKFDILSKHSTQEQEVSVKTTSIPEHEIVVPGNDPEVVKYYVKR